MSHNVTISEATGTTYSGDSHGAGADVILSWTPVSKYSY